MADATFQTAASTADGGWSTDTVSYSATGTGITIGDSSGRDWNLWALFTVTIPQGASIVTAKISLRESSGQSGTVSFKIYANDVDSASYPANAAAANALALTSEVVDWDVTATWSNTYWYDSPEIKNIVQQIIDRAGWSSGNALMILVKEDGSTTNKYRLPSSYNSASDRGPKLYVEWTTDKTYSVPAATIELVPDTVIPEIEIPIPQKNIEISGSMEPYFVGRFVSVPAADVEFSGTSGVPRVSVAVPSSLIELNGDALYKVMQRLGIPATDLLLLATAKELHGPFVFVVPATIEIDGSAIALYQTAIAVPPETIELNGSASYYIGHQIAVPAKDIKLSGAMNTPFVGQWIIVPAKNIVLSGGIVKPTFVIPFQEKNIEVTGTCSEFTQMVWGTKHYGVSCPSTIVTQYFFAITNREWIPALVCNNPWNMTYAWYFRRRNPEEITRTYYPMKSMQFRWRSGLNTTAEIVFPYTAEMLAHVNRALVYYDCEIIMKEIINGGEYVRQRTLYSHLNIWGVRYDLGSENASITLTLRGSQGYTTARLFEPATEQVMYESYDRGKWSIRMKPRLDVFPGQLMRYRGDLFYIGNIIWSISSPEQGGVSYYEIQEL